MSDRPGVEFIIMNMYIKYILQLITDYKAHHDQASPLCVRFYHFMKSTVNILDVGYCNVVDTLTTLYII